MKRFYGHPDDPENTNPPDLSDEEMDDLEIAAWEEKYESDKSDNLNSN